MILQVIGKPTSKTNAKQRISVNYNPAKEHTCVDCDADVVTLGIALNVLQNLFDEAMNKLEPSIAEEIRETTKKAVALNA